MFLFKAARTTYQRVVRQKRHAFPYNPTEVRGDELVLLSENRVGGRTLHRQVQYIAKLRRVREATPAELEQLFPHQRSGERWRFVVDLYFRRKLAIPFNLSGVLGFDEKHYRTVQGFALLREGDALSVVAHLCLTNPALIFELSDRTDGERNAS